MVASNNEGYHLLSKGGENSGQVGLWATALEVGLPMRAGGLSSSSPYSHFWLGNSIDQT